MTQDFGRHSPKAVNQRGESRKEECFQSGLETSCHVSFNNMNMAADILSSLESYAMKVIVFFIL